MSQVSSAAAAASQAGFEGSGLFLSSPRVNELQVKPALAPLGPVHVCASQTGGTFAPAQLSVMKRLMLQQSKGGDAPLAPATG